MGAFATIVEVMAGMDVFRLFFPWLLVLSISYGILNQSNAISNDEMVNGVTAIAMSFIAIGGLYFFVPAGLFTNFMAAIAFGVMAIVGLVVMMGVSGFDVSQLAEDKKGLPLIVAIIFFILAFFGVIAFQLPWGELLGGSAGTGNAFQEIVMPILVLIFLLIVILGTTG